MSQKKVALECTKCGAHNYTITANPQRQERLELRKFCKHCGEYTMHRESRQVEENMIKFIKSVNHEMKLVVWPTAKENRRDTTIVVTLTLFFVLFFALFDWLIQLLMKLFV